MNLVDKLWKRIILFPFIPILFAILFLLGICDYAFHNIIKPYFMWLRGEST